MLTSPRYGVQYPQSTDSPNVPRDLTSIVNALETSVMFTQGALASRPASAPGTPGKTGRLFATTDQSPNRLFYDYGTGWFDVGALVPNSVGTTMLADDSVTAAKIAADAVGSSEIAADAVGASEIAAGAVGNSELAAGAVAAGNMQPNAVGTAVLLDGAVTSPKIADGTIVGADLAADTLTSREIGPGAIGSSEIADGSIVGADMAPDTITQREIGPGAVSTSEVSDGSLLGSDLAADAITAREIAAGAVGTSEVADGSLLGSDLAADAITAREIAAGAVGTSEIADGSIVAGDIGNGQVTAAKQADGTYPVAGVNWPALGTKIDGKVGKVYLANGEVMTVVYDSNSGFWVSPPFFGVAAATVAAFNGTAYAIGPVLMFDKLVYQNAGFNLQAKGIGFISTDDPNGAQGSSATLEIYFYEAGVGDDQIQYVTNFTVATWGTTGWTRFGKAGFYTISYIGGRELFYIGPRVTGQWYAGGTHNITAHVTTHCRWVA